jgi:iron(III) transport system ATP-binding protein
VSLEHGATLRVVNLEKHFRRQHGRQVAAVDSVSLDIVPGSMVAVLGPSGSGKTTLLRCIAGLETPTGGEIWNGGQLLSSGERGVLVPPEARNFGMMFQSYAVWPHMTVFGNVAYPLKVRRLPKAEIEERVTRMLRVVGIEHLRDEYPSNVSGGQQQRVALARCLVRDPKVILFDEPLSNVDAKVREELRVELLAMHKRLGFAGLYVTHDQEEAMVISDRIVVMDEGKVIQVDTPREVYRRPRSRFVANFIGVANIWEGKIKPDGRQPATTTVATTVGDMIVANENVPSGLASDGDDVIVMARPEGLSVAAERPGDSPDATVMPGVLRAEMFRGSHSELLVDVGNHMLRVRSTRSHALAEGSAVFVIASPAALYVLPHSEGPTAEPTPIFDLDHRDPGHESPAGAPPPATDGYAPPNVRVASHTA